MSSTEKSTSSEALEQYRHEFIDMLAHVLRNQVAAMGGYADLVAGSGDLNEDQSLFLERVQSGADRLNRMLPMLIDLVWLDAGIPLQKQPVALDQIVADVVVDLETQAALKGIQISIAINEPLPELVGDATRLKQAVIEILRNALVYSPAGSSVNIQLWSNKKGIHLSISDQGIGINELDQDLIFDRLYRSSDPRVRDIQGSGLGLTLANRIARAHGGDLKVVTQIDQGSIFTLTIPLAH